MAHFAQLDSNNVVVNVIVVGNNDTSDNAGVETEEIGVAFCQKLIGSDTTWKQTSYNSSIRGNFAGIGYTYMENVATLGVGSTDIFINQKPHPSWTISTTEASWIAPVDRPTLTEEQEIAGAYLVWDESAYQADTSDPKTAGWTVQTNE